MRRGLRIRNVGRKVRSTASGSVVSLPGEHDASMPDVGAMAKRGEDVDEGASGLAFDGEGGVEARGACKNLVSAIGSMYQFT